MFQIIFISTRKYKKISTHKVLKLRDNFSRVLGYKLNELGLLDINSMSKNKK